MKKKVIVISPAIKGWRIALFFSMIFLLGLGLAAYFIPYSIFTLKVTEQHQKEIVSQQNDLLNRKIAASLPLLENLKTRIRLLEEKKENVRALTAASSVVSDAVVSDKSAEKKKPDPVKITETLRQKEPIILQYSELAKKSNPFQSIPVCKPVTDPNCIVSAPFGINRDPFTGKNKWHYGIDFSGEKGAAVVATAKGSVAGIVNDRVWGLTVSIDHGFGYSTRYAHLGKVKTASGRRVDRGDTIGTIGNTGITTGPRVHYEVWYKGSVINPEQLFFPQLD